MSDGLRETPLGAVREAHEIGWKRRTDLEKQGVETQVWEGPDGEFLLHHGRTPLQFHVMECD